MDTLSQDQRDLLEAIGDIDEGMATWAKQLMLMCADQDRPTTTSINFIQNRLQRVSKMVDGWRIGRGA